MPTDRDPKLNRQPRIQWDEGVEVVDPCSTRGNFEDSCVFVVSASQKQRNGFVVLKQWWSPTPVIRGAWQGLKSSKLVSLPSYTNPFHSWNTGNLTEQITTSFLGGFQWKAGFIYHEVAVPNPKIAPRSSWWFRSHWNTATETQPLKQSNWNTYKKMHKWSISMIFYHLDCNQIHTNNLYIETHHPIVYKAAKLFTKYLLLTLSYYPKVCTLASPENHAHNFKIENKWHFLIANQYTTFHQTTSFIKHLYILRYCLLCSMKSLSVTLRKNVNFLPSKPPKFKLNQILACALYLTNINSKRPERSNLEIYIDHKTVVHILLVWPFKQASTARLPQTTSVEKIRTYSPIAFIDLHIIEFDWLVQPRRRLCGQHSIEGHTCRSETIDQYIGISLRCETHFQLTTHQRQQIFVHHPTRWKKKFCHVCWRK